MSGLFKISFSNFECNGITSITLIIQYPDGKIVQTLTSVVAANASTQLEKYKQLFVADYFKVNA